MIKKADKNYVPNIPCQGCEERRKILLDAFSTGDPRQMFQALSKTFESGVHDVKKLVNRQEDESK